MVYSVEAEKITTKTKQKFCILSGIFDFLEFSDRIYITFYFTIVRDSKKHFLLFVIIYFIKDCRWKISIFEIRDSLESKKHPNGLDRYQFEIFSRILNGYSRKNL